MTNAQSTGWRALKPVIPQVGKPHTADKKDLYEAARLAMRVLALPSSCRFVLEHLIGAYGGELIGGRMIVWPSNAYLEERTFLCERTIRLALAHLIREGVIVSVDSPNGKRFPQRDGSGKIVRAYGFDLSPLLNRLSEMTDRLVAIKEREREQRAAWDQLTISRRATQEALRALEEHFPDVDTRELTKRAHELARVTPRRSPKGSTEPYLSLWTALRTEAEALFHSACAGNNCRHKDTNKHAPENPCNNGMEDVGESAATPKANLRDLVAACPDAIDVIGEVQSDGQLIAAAGRNRGQFGVSPSAWEEARREIGPLPAAAAFILVMQIQARPAPGAEQIKNFGGYFRAYVRLIRDGRISIDGEIRRLKR